MSQPSKPPHSADAVGELAEGGLEPPPLQLSVPRSLAYRVFDHALMALNSIGTAWIFLLMLLICADVVGRSVFNHPIDGVSDIAAFSIIGIVFLQLGATIQSNRMTRSTMLLELIEKKSRRASAAIEAAYLFVGAIMFALILRATWPLLVRSFQRHEFFGVQGVFTFPNWPVRLIMIVGALAATLVYLIQVWERLRFAFTHNPADER